MPEETETLEEIEQLEGALSLGSVKTWKEESLVGFGSDLDRQLRQRIA